MPLATPIFSRKTNKSSNEEMRCENKNTNSLPGKRFKKHAKISLVSCRRHWAGERDVRGRIVYREAIRFRNSAKTKSHKSLIL